MRTLTQKVNYSTSEKVAAIEHMSNMDAIGAGMSKQNMVLLLKSYSMG
jgi:hypothetical protein